MTIVDTSVWIDFFAGRDTRQTNLLYAKLGSEPVGIGDLILTEVLQGFRSDAHHRLAKRRLLTLPVFEMLGIERAVRAADYYRRLRKQGLTIRKTTDVIIASYSIDNGHSLLYSDKDFDPFVEHFGLVSA